MQNPAGMDTAAMEETFAELAARMVTAGGRTWVQSVLAPAAGSWNGTGHAVYDGYGGSVLQPWPQVARWVDSAFLRGPGTAASVALREALDGFVDDAVARLPTPAIGALSGQEAVDVLGELDWSIPVTAKVLELQDGHSAWTRNDADGREAAFRVGEYLFQIRFHRSRLQGSEDDWTMGWGCLVNVPPGTGLFPRIAQAVRDHVREFLERWEPASLGFGGGDVKRSTFYASACPDWTPEGYDCEIAWRGDLDAAGRDRRADAIFRRAVPGVRLRP